MFATLNLSESEDTNLTSADTQMLLERHRPIKIGIISVLGAMITLGNIAVIMVISSSVSGWSRNSRYFLLSLTGADSAFGLIITPLNLCVSLAKDYSEGPDALCHIVAFFNAMIYTSRKIHCSVLPAEIVITDDKEKNAASDRLCMVFSSIFTCAHIFS